MARELIEPEACIRCDAKPASFCFGPPLTDKPYRLCFACWMMTPDGVKAIQGQIKQQLDIEETE